MRLINIYIFLLSLMSFCAAGVEAELDYDESTQLISLKIVNTDSFNKLQPSNLCLSALGNLTLILLDQSGNRRKLATKVNDGCNGNSETMLPPYRFFGRAFSVEEVKSYYKLSRGKYRIKGQYCRSINAKTSLECVETKEVLLEIFRD